MKVCVAMSIILICLACENQEQQDHSSNSRVTNISTEDLSPPHTHHTDSHDGHTVLDMSSLNIPMLDQNPMHHTDATIHSDFNLDLLDAGAMDSNVLDALPPVSCQPTELAQCEGWRIRSCRPDGRGYQVASCPQGQVCWSGACVDVHPNVILIMDTSGSMNQLIDSGEDPAECQGDSCPAWDYPICDDINTPYTRIGRAKNSIQAVINHPRAQQTRLALQKFPQTLGLPPLPAIEVSCYSGWYANHDSLSQHSEEHGLSKEILADQLHEIMVVPLDDHGQTNQQEIIRHTDFIEDIMEQTDSTCTRHQDCLDGFCRNRCQYIRTEEFGTCQEALGWGVNTLGQCVAVNGCACDESCQGRVFATQQACQDQCQKVCYTHSNPELRAIGSTPIGQSLFYAGEYFRHFVVKEGMACTQDSDCESVDYQCVDGQCHDPLLSCRQNVVVLFSDGYETDHEDADDFFNPRIQAKRLHFGLGCTQDQECSHGARCVEQVCTTPTLNPQQKVCKGNGVPCAQDEDCPSYACGLAMSSTCPGACIMAGFDFTDTQGYNQVLNEAGHPITVTIHMIDASSEDHGGYVIAQAGGGGITHIDFTSAEVIIEQLNTLIHSKTDDSYCR